MWRVATRRRSTRRLRILAAGLAVLALSTGGLATVSVAQNRAVVHERDLAVSRQLAVTAQSLTATDPALAGQVAVAAHQTADTVEARTALLSASGGTAVARLGQTDGVINALAVSPDGSTVAVGTDAGQLTLWSTGTAPRQITALPAKDGALYDVAFSDGGRLVAAASADGTVRLWHAQPDGSFGQPDALPTFTGTVQAVALDPRGTMLAAAGSDGLVALWNLTNSSTPALLGATFTAAAGKITSLDLSPDGKTLAVGSADSFVHLWDVTTPAAPVAGLKLSGAASWINDVRFNSDGSLLAAASSDCGTAPTRTRRSS